MDLASWILRYAETRSHNTSKGLQLSIRVCPKCNNNKFKLYVNVDKGLWHCKVCQWGRGTRNLIEFGSIISGKTFDEVRAELNFAGAPALSKDDISQDINSAFDPIEILDNKFEIVDFPKTEDLTRTGQRYMQDRGIVNYMVLNYAMKRGLTLEETWKYNLRAAYEVPGAPGDNGCHRIHYGPFLVALIYDANGRLATWQARSIYDGTRKYISGPYIGYYLWPWPLTPSIVPSTQTDNNTVVLVEGIFDVIGLSRLGYLALCSFGKNLTMAQIQILKRIAPANIIIGWDRDAAFPEQEGASESSLDKAVSELRKHVDADLYVSSIISRDGKKVDFGNILDGGPECISLALDALRYPMDVYSAEYYKWRLECIHEKR